MKKPLKQSQNFTWNYYISRSNAASCEYWQRCRWTKLFGWKV